MAKKITREGSQVAPTPVHKKVTKRVHAKAKEDAISFVEFVRVQGVIGLAIGFIIGTQAKLIVDQLSNSFINPLLGLIVGSPEGLSGKALHITIASRSATFGWGAFLYAIINFLIIAALIFFTFRWLHLDKLDKKKP